MKVKPRLKVLYAWKGRLMWLCSVDGIDGYQDWSPASAYRGWLRCFGERYIVKSCDIT